MKFLETPLRGSETQRLVLESHKKSAQRLSIGKDRLMSIKVAISHLDEDLWGLHQLPRADESFGNINGGNDF
jgi:hypothetical protein